MCNHTDTFIPLKRFLFALQVFATHNLKSFEEQKRRNGWLAGWPPSLSIVWNYYLHCFLTHTGNNQNVHEKIWCSNCSKCYWSGSHHSAHTGYKTDNTLHKSNKIKDLMLHIRCEHDIHHGIEYFRPQRIVVSNYKMWMTQLGKH